MFQSPTRMHCLTSKSPLPWCEFSSTYHVVMAFGVDVSATNRIYSFSTFALAGGPDKSICIRHMLCFHCLSCIRLCNQILACEIPNVQCALGYLTSWNTELPIVCDLLHRQVWKLSQAQAPFFLTFRSRSERVARSGINLPLYFTRPKNDLNSETDSGSLGSITRFTLSAATPTPRLRRNMAHECQFIHGKLAHLPVGFWDNQDRSDLWKRSVNFFNNIHAFQLIQFLLNLVS